jgi:hypothetical protein
MDDNMMGFFYVLKERDGPFSLEEKESFVIHFFMKNKSLCWMSEEK